MGIQFKADFNIGVDKSELSHKFIGSFALILRGHIAGLNDEYVNIAKSKFKLILFIRVDVLCLHGQNLAKIILTWNPTFPWVLGLRRHDMMRNYSRNYGTMSLEFLLYLRFYFIIFVPCKGGLYTVVI